MPLPDEIEISQNFAVVRFDRGEPYLVIDPPPNIRDIARDYWEKEQTWEAYDSFADYVISLGHKCVKPTFHQMG